MKTGSGEMIRNRLAFAALAAIAALEPAFADVTISSAATQNMFCSGGVCAPTAEKAVLNATDLQTMLATGSVKVTTTGRMGVQANDIHARVRLSWQNASKLTLDAYQSIRIERHIAVEGSGGLSITTNDGGVNGTFSFGPKGRVSVKKLSSPLTINGVAYTLVKSIASLAKALAANPSGDYALADNYDASQDGTYPGTPITTTVSGIVEGLGNVISNISVVTKKREDAAGLFDTIDNESTVENLGLEAVKIKMGQSCCATMNAGGLALLNSGLLFGDHVTGSISQDAHKTESGSLAGGLVVENAWNIVNCYSTADVYSDGGSAGGLVGYSEGVSISGSFATGKVTVVYETNYTYVGGLVAVNATPTQIVNSYSTGAADTQGEAPIVGGFIGYNDRGSATTSYSTGKVTKGQFGAAGGFIGSDLGDSSDCYWDTDKSGQNEGTGGGNVPGITGLTTKQFRSGLPQGFNRKIWTQKKGINHGFPYLIDNPPPK